MRATLTAFIIMVLTLAGATAMSSHTMQVAPAKAPQGPAKTPAPTATPARANTVPAPAHAVMTDADLTKFVQTTCTGCHNDKTMADGSPVKAQFGNLSLAKFDVATAAKNAEVSEKMIRKLRAGFMPPPTSGVKPPAESILALTERLENKVDAAAKLDPNPGSR